MWRYIHDESGATLWVNQEQKLRLKAMLFFTWQTEPVLSQTKNTSNFLKTELF